MTNQLDQAAVTAADIFTEQHTAYRFDAAPVSDVELAHIYDLAKFTPTAMNSQPLRVVFIRSEAAKKRLLPLLAEGNQAKSESAPVVAILAADTDFHVHLPVVVPQMAGAKEMFEGNPDGRVATAVNNAWLQAGGFILAVRAAGLDAGPMNGYDSAGVDAEFFAGTALRSFMVVNIGHVAEGGRFPRNPRLGFDQAVTLL
jgi:3-hydroxypropanoate dehydrogenase